MDHLDSKWDQGPPTWDLVEKEIMKVHNQIKRQKIDREATKSNLKMSKIEEVLREVEKPISTQKFQVFIRPRKDC